MNDDKDQILGPNSPGGPVAPGAEQPHVNVTTRVERYNDQGAAGNKIADVDARIAALTGSGTGGVSAKALSDRRRAEEAIAAGTSATKDITIAPTDIRTSDQLRVAAQARQEERLRSRGLLPDPSTQVSYRFDWRSVKLPVPMTGYDGTAFQREWRAFAEEKTPRGEAMIQPTEDEARRWLADRQGTPDPEPSPLARTVTVEDAEPVNWEVINRPWGSTRTENTAPRLGNVRPASLGNVRR